LENITYTIWYRKNAAYNDI